MRDRGALLHLFTNCKSDTKNTQNTLATAYQRPGNHPQHPGILAMSSARSNLMLFHKKSSLTRNWTTSFERHWHKWISLSWFYALFLLLTYVTDIISLNVSPICGILFHLVPTCQKSNRLKKELPQNNTFLLTSKSWFGNIFKCFYISKAILSDYRYNRHKQGHVSQANILSFLQAFPSL